MFRFVTGSFLVATVVVVTLAGTVGRSQEPESPATEATASSGEPLAPSAPPAAKEGPIPTKNLLQVIKDGGVLMIPICGCSVLLLIFVFERAISLRRSRVIPKPFVRRFFEQLNSGQLDKESALARCEENGSPVAVVFAAAVKKWGRSSVEVEQAIIDTGERVTNGLRAYLRLFNGISTISPLLGLLGTVLGMIESFNMIATASAMGRPDMLAGGISVALITTAAGLCVAIPALSAYLFFVSRVDRLIVEIDALGQDLVEIISAEALQDEPLEKNTKSKRREKAA